MTSSIARTDIKDDDEGSSSPIFLHPSYITFQPTRVIDMLSSSNYKRSIFPPALFLLAASVSSATTWADNHTQRFSVPLCAVSIFSLLGTNLPETVGLSLFSPSRASLTRSLVLSPLGYSISVSSSASSSTSLDAAKESMDNNVSDNSDEKSPNSGKDTTSLPQLPAVDPNDPTAASLPSIKLGESISLETMGPIILNSDGTTRRIANWDNMTPQEQKVAWRRISKRNEERRLELLAKQEQQEKESSDGTDQSPAEKDEL